MKQLTRYTALSLTAMCVGFLLYEASCVSLGSGYRDFRVQIVAPVGVRAVYASAHTTEQQAGKIIDWLAESDSQSLKLPDTLLRLDNDTFLASVMTESRRSRHGITLDTYYQPTHELILIELDNGAYWVAVLKLPNMQHDRNPLLVVTLPDDARLIREGNR